MQDTSVSNPTPAPPVRAPSFWATVFTWTGALASIALIVGVSIWTYRLGLRDALDVPIIQAMAGPAKIAPADPGGKVVAHQGLAVNEVLAGNSNSGVSRIQTAPGATGLSDEDKPRVQLAALERAAKPTHRPKFKKAPAAPAVEEAQATLAAVQIDDEPRVPALGETAKLADQPVEEVELPVVDPAAKLRIEVEKTVVASVEPSAKPTTGPARVLVAAEPDPAPVRAPDAEPAIVENDKPSEPVVEPLRNVEQALAEVRAEEEVAALEAGKPNPPQGVGSKFAPARSLAPTPRPTRVAAAQTPAQKPEKSGEEVATRDISGDDVRPGTRMVQLGAYGSEAVAKRQWDLIINANSDLLGAKRRYIQRTQSNGKTFYRLRASSFETLEASRAACSALSARGVPCIPTIAN